MVQAVREVLLDPDTSGCVTAIHFEAGQAAAVVRQLEARIQQKNTRAPFPGQIGVRRINTGQYLNAGDVIATLTLLDPLHVNFTLPQQELPKLASDTPIRVTADAAPDKVFTAGSPT